MASAVAEKKGPQERPVTRKVNENYTRHIADALGQPPYSGQYDTIMDIVAVQDKRLLAQDNRVEFLKSLLPHGEKTFGFANLDNRRKEPSMHEIFSYGYEAPVKNDYTKNKAEISNKIRKMKRAYISEAHDNYRKPHSVAETDSQYDANKQYLFNYFDSDEIELFKKKLFQAATIKEREIRNQTMYKEFFGSADALRQKLNEIQTWSAAGRKPPVCQMKRELYPDLDQKQGKLWLFGERPEVMNAPVEIKKGVDQGGQAGPLITPMQL